jgi:tRNA threonylcarbamoyladenosine biosynthesis protein TsaE
VSATDGGATDGGSTTVLTSSVEQTRALGERLATVLRAGDLIVLSGPLGAGKTALAQGIGAGLGVRGPVTSPTFVLAREHRADPARGGTVPLLHVDAYRLRDDREGAAAAPSLDDIEDLGLATGLAEAVVVVEWGEGLGDALAPSWLEIRIDRGDPRCLTARGHGPRWAGVHLGRLLTSNPD